MRDIEPTRGDNRNADQSPDIRYITEDKISKEDCPDPTGVGEGRHRSGGSVLESLDHGKVRYAAKKGRGTKYCLIIDD